MNYPLYQKTLCPDIWDEKNLKPEIRTALLKIATDFIEELAKDHELKVEVNDVLFIGSLTNYNWSAYSDVDIHISADYSKLVMPPEDAQIMFDAIKAGWNRTHNITIKKHDVEIYVQDVHDKQTSAAEYSLKQGKWLKEPVFNVPQFNKELIKTKFKEYQKTINALLAKHDEDGLRRLLDKVYKFRRAGLNAGGELSEENIVFKILRSSGLLDKLKDSIVRIYDKKMSVDEMLTKGFWRREPHNATKLNEESGGRKLAYHIGHGKNHDSIVRRGFIPNSPTMGDTKDTPGVYFFPNSVALEDAWDTWMENKFDDNEQIICYIVDIHGLSQHEGADYEIIVTESVPPDRIVKWKDLNAPVESLRESHVIDDGISSPGGNKIIWDRDENEGEYCLVPTDDDEEERLHSVFKIPVWAAYKVSSPGVTAMRTGSFDPEAVEMGVDLVNLRKAVKHPDASSKKTLSDLIEISIRRFISDKSTNASQITVIIPLGSNSKTNLYIADRLTRKLPNTVVLKDFLEKDVWKNVQASPKFWEFAKNNGGISQGKPVGVAKDFLDRLESSKRNHPEEKFGIKHVRAKERLYYSMFYKTDKYMIDAVKRLNGANVLLIDDTLEAGSTLIDAHRELEQYNIKSLMAFIFLYGKDVRAPKVSLPRHESP